VLAEEPITNIYSSPQLRARQTARILAQPHPDAQVHITKLLAEVLTGWQGRPHSELEVIHFGFYEHPINPEDETIKDVWERTRRFVDLARRRHVGQTVVGVTHGDSVIIAQAGYLGKPLELASLRHPNVYPGNGSITRLVFGPDRHETYPLSVEYYDPNSPDPALSSGWVRLKPEGQE
jgi:broad specificity phosphatase PhoE